MSNPRLLLCDTDALIQLFRTPDFTKKLLPLRHLKEEYGIQPAIVEEVENELMWTRKFGSQFAAGLRKALSNGTILLLDSTSFPTYVPPNLAKAVYASYQALGIEQSKYADPGEAYTLAAAMTLSEPAISNDATAIRALEMNGFALPSPVLRLFDILALCCQVGVMTAQECDDTRQELVRLGEHVPRAFQGCSFQAGLKRFCPRMLDGALGSIGAPAGPGPAYKIQIKIDRKT